MSSKELAITDIPVSDEVVRREYQSYRDYIIQQRLKGFVEIDGVDPDEEHLDYEAKLLWQKIGEANRLYVLVIPVNVDLDPWGMDLRESDDPQEVLHHPYGYGTKRGLVPETSLLDQPKAA